MKEKLITIIALLMVCSGITFAADPQVTIMPKWADLNPEAKECDGFSEDSLILKIKIDKKEITDEFCSSYGKADAKIIRDTRGVNYLLLVKAQGRGTHVTSEYLTIYRIEKYLEEYARIPVSEPIGRLSGSHFDYKIKKPKEGGLILTFSLNIEGVTEDEEWLPKKKKMTMQIK